MISRLLNLRFEILERVGEGVLFQACKARDKSSGRIVAVKTVQPVFAQDDRFTEALKEVMPAFKNLAHSNIARLEEVGEEDGSPYLVTEFVRGINLKERIRRIAPFTLSVAVDFAIAIGEALQHAHSQGFVHGDLRSHNVIVSPEGAVKVTDFGLARALAVSPEAYAANLARSVYYHAPEVSAGRPPSVSTDLYALGTILFEMLTGSVPYSSDTPEAVVARQLNEPVPSPRAHNPGVPKSVEGIVMKALMKRPEERYKSAADMLNDLKTVRDALRFGKPLSWSPLEGDSSIEVETLSPVPVAVAGAAPVTRGTMETETSGALRMPRQAVNDDRISPYLKAALYAVVFVLIAAGIGFTAFWMATFAKPPEQKFPELKGMKIEEARKVADGANVKLLIHEAYKDDAEPGIIYQVDQPPAGRPLRPGRGINVWVSKGSRLVYVPDLTNLGKDEAEQKLKAAGLVLGTVNRENDKKIPFDSIISQNPRARKRVNRDTAVSLTVSDGPKGDEGSTGETSTDGNETSTHEETPPNGADAVGNPATDHTNDAERANEVNSVNLTKKIPKDGLGSRRVRIEYDDSHGTHTPIDERHDEGETVTLRVDSYGPKITVRVYYGEDSKPVSERTMTFKKP